MTVHYCNSDHSKTKSNLNYGNSWSNESICCPFLKILSSFTFRNLYSSSSSEKDQKFGREILFTSSPIGLSRLISELQQVDLNWPFDVERGKQHSTLTENPFRRILFKQITVTRSQSYKRHFITQRQILTLLLSYFNAL